MLKADGRVRITARLVEAASDHHVWAISDQRDHRDILDLQNEVTRDIAENIKLNLTVATRQRLAASRPIEPEAHEDCLRGRFYLAKRRTSEVKKAVVYFEKAIARDPRYARAYAGLADSYSVIRAYNLAPPSESIRHARAAALKALELDEGLAEAHTSLGLIAQIYDWDWQAAEQQYRRAIQLDSSYATAHHWYAELLAYRGRFDEAFARIKRACWQAGPALPDHRHRSRGDSLSLTRLRPCHCAGARRSRNGAAILQAHYILAFSLVQKGLFAEALADLERWRGSDETPWSLMMDAYIHGRAGHRVQARHALQKLVRLRQLQPMDPAPLLLAHVGMGNTEAAFAVMEELNGSIRRRSPASG